MSQSVFIIPPLYSSVLQISRHVYPVFTLRLSSFYYTENLRRQNGDTRTCTISLFIYLFLTSKPSLTLLIS